MTGQSLHIRAAAAVRAPRPARSIDVPDAFDRAVSMDSIGSINIAGYVDARSIGAASIERRASADLHLDYFSDLLAPFGLKPDEELLRGGPRVEHSDLVDLLLADEALAASIPDLLIVAHALPDVVPFTAVAPYLSRRLGGQPTNFAVGQQGLAAPFTAPRIAGAHAAAGRSRQTVLAVLEQTTLPTRFDLVHRTPLVDSAAALVLEAGPDGEAGLRFERATHDVSPSVVVKLCGGLDEGAGDTLLVLGPWFPGDFPFPPGPATHRVREGTYCTSVWIELARHWQEWQRSYGTVVLCDTDPRYGETHGAVFRS